MQNIDEFIEQLLVDKGITDLDLDIKTELKTDMKARLVEQINKAAILELPEEKAIELSKLSEDPNFKNEDAKNFIKNAGINLAEVAQATMQKFRNFYLMVED